MSSLVFFCLFLVAVYGAGLAPLFTHRQTIDQNGLRSYLVRFNSQAPDGLSSLPKLKDWLGMELPLINPENVGGVWMIGSNFQGFSAFLSLESLASVRSHSYILTVEEDSIVTIAQTSFLSRRDWGQIRVNQSALNLATTLPAEQSYPNAYPSGSAPLTTWNWAAGVQQDSGSFGRGSTVCVIDTGVYKEHQEFYEAGSTTTRVVAEVSFIPGEGPQDLNGHGTHCAGSAAGLNRGMAPAAKIVNSKALGAGGSGTLAGVIQAIQYCTDYKNATPDATVVMSMSLSSSYSQAVNDAIAASAFNLVIPVAAAGNNYWADACSRSPASSDQAITVAATDSADNVASFSNIGTCVNINAPGVNVHSSWIGAIDAYNTISGTSMATPLVAGTVAVFGDPAFGLTTEPLKLGNAKEFLTTYSNQIRNPPPNTVPYLASTQLHKS